MWDLTFAKRLENTLREISVDLLALLDAQLVLVEVVVRVLLLRLVLLPLRLVTREVTRLVTREVTRLVTRRSRGWSTTSTRASSRPRAASPVISHNVLIKRLL